MSRFVGLVNKINVLHIFNDQKKFSKKYFEFLFDKSIDLSRHFLFHYGVKDDCFSNFGMPYIFSNHFYSPFEQFKLLKLLVQSEKVIVHSLASPSLLFYLFIFPKLNKKIHWVVWGKDLYFFNTLKKKYIHHYIYEFFRKNAFKKVAFIIPIISEDYELARQWYHVTGVEIECNLLYPYSVDTSDSQEIIFHHNKIFTLIVGNSASDTNNHMEVLENLAVHEKQIKKIYCPLSYSGKKNYVNNVVKAGNDLFGNRFVPLLELIDYKKYLDILSEVDVAVYNHSRQEGLGNILSLINMGKSVYLRSDITTWGFFKRKGVTILDTKSLKSHNIMILDQETLALNQKNMRAAFNEQVSINTWKKIFYGQEVIE